MLNQDSPTCESEPIHIPGAIQGHGLFFALLEPGLEIVTSSTNAPEVLGLAGLASLLGRPLSEHLEPESLERLHKALEGSSLEAANPLRLGLRCGTRLPQTQAGGRERCPDGSLCLYRDGILHRMQGLLILELEPSGASERLSFFSFYHAVQLSMFRLEKATTIPGATQIAAEEVAGLTGFGRVMVYQFDDDWHGQVLAEALAPDLNMDSYLGLHFPQSDIPAQARRLYTLNSLRLISDVGYRPVPLEPDRHPLSGAPLDLSLSTLRSVSPVHLTYLRNMKVGASMSISIMKNDQLWGLIACHHPTAHDLSFQLRSACRFIGQLLAQQIHTIEARHALGNRAAVRARLNELRPAFQESQASKFLAPLAKDLLDLVAAEGAAFYLQNRWQLFGRTPTTPELDGLLAWLRAKAPEGLYSTHRLSRDYEPARAFASQASGLLAAPLSKTGGHLLWFRPEVVQTVYWAGEPKKAEAQGTSPLSPRHSFASWKEVLREQATPWNRAELEAALDLRDLMVTQEFERLNLELQRSNAELDAFASIASHDLREPLRGMRSYAQFIVEDEAAALSPLVRTRLETIQNLGEKTENLIDGLYQYSRLGRIAFTQQETDLEELLSEVIIRLEVFFEEKGVRLLRDRALPRLICDRLRVGEVYYNLLLNAAKYNDKPDKWIRVGWLEDEARTGSGPDKGKSKGKSKGKGPILFVEDNGIGIPAAQQGRVFAIFKRGLGSEKFGSGTGTGLTLAQRIVENHGGRIWLESTVGRGSTFYWTLGSH